MPVQLYEKQQILDACLAVFARTGYEKTSVGVLAEAAGTSKALLFHHFQNKKGLYLSVLDRCFERARTEMGVADLPAYGDFFEAMVGFSLTKLQYYQQHPDVYRVVREAIHATPPELKADIQERYGPLIAGADAVWGRLFDKVSLREGVDRADAFELISLMVEYFEERYFADATPESQRDDPYVKRFHQRLTSFLNMIRHGIEAGPGQ